MDTVLLVAYLLALLLQVIVLIAAVRTPTRLRWIMLFAAEVITLAAALVLAAYFNAQPGYGMMPGLTYFAEVIFSLAAAAAVSAMLLISALCALILLIRRKNAH